MCGRYTLITVGEEFTAEFDVSAFEPFVPRYNIAPTQRAPIVRAKGTGHQREVVLFKWGLIPHWAKDPAIGSRMINARAETVEQKPAFRTALQRQRCLIPCSGFYEWKVLLEVQIGRNRAKKQPLKQPFYIRRCDERLFVLAGLWDRWHSPDGEEVGSFTILTTEPNELVRGLHDRMPVVIPRDKYELWLDCSQDGWQQIAPLLKPWPADGWVAHPVGMGVNNPALDDPTCIRAIE